MMTNNNPTKSMRYFLCTAVIGYNQFQQARISYMGMIRDFVRRRSLGIPLDAVESKKEKKKYDKAFSYQKLPGHIQRLQQEGKITDEEKFKLDILMDQAAKTAKVEGQ